MLSRDKQLGFKLRAYVVLRWVSARAKSGPGGGVNFGAIVVLRHRRGELAEEGTRSRFLVAPFGCRGTLNMCSSSSVIRLVAR